MEEEYQEIQVMHDDKTRGHGQKIALKLCFENAQQVSKVLANAYRLKHYNRMRVFLAQDLAFAERMKLRNLVKLLRENILNYPTCRWKIVKDQVVNVGVFKNSFKRTIVPEKL